MYSCCINRHWLGPKSASTNHILVPLLYPVLLAAYPDVIEVLLTGVSAKVSTLAACKHLSSEKGNIMIPSGLFTAPLLTLPGMEEIPTLCQAFLNPLSPIILFTKFFGET